MAQQVQVELNAKDNVSPALTGVAGKLEVLKARVQGNREGINKLNNGLENLASDALGATGAFGQLAESVFAFTGMTAPVLGVVAAVGALVAVNQQAKKATEEYKKAQDDLNIAFAKSKNEYAGAQAELKTLGEDLTDVQIKADNAANSFTDKLANALLRIQSIAPGILLPVVQGLGKLSEKNLAEANKKVTETQAAYRRQLDATSAAAISTFSSLIELSKVQKLSTAQQKTLADVTGIVVTATKSENAQVALSAINALKAVDAKKEKNKTTVEEIDLLAKGNSLGILTNKQSERYNVLLQNQQLIVKSNKASLEDKIKAQERLNANEALLEEQLKKTEQAYKDQISALLESVSIGIRSEDVTNRLESALAEEEQRLGALIPLTKEWIDQSEIVADLRDRLAQSRQIVTSDQDRENLQAQIERARSEQEAMISMVSAGVGDGGIIETLTNRLVGLQGVYKTTSDIIQRSQIASEIKSIEDALMSSAKDTNKFKILSDVISVTAESFTLLAQSIGQGTQSLPAFGRAFAQMISGYARQKAALMVGESLEQVAKGISAAFNPITAPLAAGYFSSAAKFAAAAAAFGVVSGGAAAAGGAGGANAATGFVRSNFGDSTGGIQQVVNIVFPEGLIDMSNPRTQREFSAMINQVAGNRQINFAGVV